MKVSFIGHKTIERTEALISRLKATVVTLINKGATTFLFGSGSEFDHISWQVVTELKKEYPHIKRIYVRAAYQDIEKSYEKYLLGLYEETYFPIRIRNAGKYSYVERNFEMIDQAMYCVFYYNKNYDPPLRRASKHSLTLATKRNSGTKIAYEYATKKKKEIINIY